MRPDSLNDLVPWGQFKKHNEMRQMYDDLFFLYNHKV